MPLLYLVGLLSLAMLCAASPAIKNKSLNNIMVRAFVFIAILFLSLFHSQRSLESGFDTINYFLAFSHYESLSLDNLSVSGLSYGYISQEKGYSAISFALSRVTDFQGFLAVIAFSSLLASFIFYSKMLGKNSSLAFFVLVCGVSSTYLYGAAIRQGLALPIGFLGFYFISEKRYKLGVVFFLTALLIHSSALFLILISAAAVVLAGTQKPSARKLFYYLLISSAFLYLLSTLSVNLGSQGGGFLQKAAYYLRHQKGGEVGYVALAYPVLLFFIFYSIYDGAPRNIRALVIIYGMVFSLQIMFKDSAEPFYRIGMYRFFIEPILLMFSLRFFSQKFNISFPAVSYLVIFSGLIYCNFYTFTREEVLFTLGL